MASESIVRGHVLWEWWTNFWNQFCPVQGMGYIHSYHTSFRENKKKIVLKLPLGFIEYVWWQLWYKKVTRTRSRKVIRRKSRRRRRSDDKKKREKEWGKKRRREAKKKSRVCAWKGKLTNTRYWFTDLLIILTTLRFLWSIPSECALSKSILRPTISTRYCFQLWLKQCWPSVYTGNSSECLVGGIISNKFQDSYMYRHSKCW